MKVLNFSGFGLCVSAAAIMLSACGGSARPPVSVPAAMPQSSIDTGREGLVYASRYSADAVSIFSYPDAHKVGELSGIAKPWGLCSDTAGNVYITSQGDNGKPSHVYEYAHGGTSPIKTFTDAGAQAFGCAVDPTTGDLAVTNYSTSQGSNYGDVAIFKGTLNNPKTYSLNGIAAFLFCTFDRSGNLYASGISAELAPVLVQLHRGTPALRGLYLPQTIAPVSLQWIKNRLLVSTAATKRTGVASIYPVRVSGYTMKVDTPIDLQDAFRGSGFREDWILADRVVGLTRVMHNGALIFWKYPHGGKPVEIVRTSSKELFSGVTVSIGALTH